MSRSSVLGMAPLGKSVSSDVEGFSAALGRQALPFHVLCFPLQQMKGWT